MQPGSVVIIRISCSVLVDDKGNLDVQPGSELSESVVLYMGNVSNSVVHKISPTYLPKFCFQ